MLTRVRPCRRSAARGFVAGFDGGITRRGANCAVPIFLDAGVLGTSQQRSPSDERDVLSMFMGATEEVAVVLGHSPK